MKKIGLIGICILLIGCTTIEHSHIPFCNDINITGTDCHSPADLESLFDDDIKLIFKERDYNWSNAICKYYRAIGTENRLTFCFNTMENIDRIWNETIGGCNCMCNGT